MSAEEAQCEVLRPSQVEEMAGLLAATFSTGDPLAVAMGLSFREMAAFVRPLGSKAAGEGLTIVARNPAGGELMGVLLVDDFALPPSLELTQLSEKFLPIFDLLEGLDYQYRATRAVAPGQCLHLYMLGVDARFAGRGIAQRLVQTCLANGRKKGYQWALTEATGTVSQGIFRKLGFADRFQASYRDYRYQGHAVFASIPGHGGTILMDRPLA